MSISSNLYASKIFSEHPSSIYTLDDDVSYISLISNEKRLFQSSGWTASADNSASVSFNDSPEIPSTPSPFDDSTYSSFSASAVTSDPTEIVIESVGIFNFEDLNQEMSTFSISFYLYQDSLYVNWYEVGYVYYDQYLGQDKEVTTRIEAEEARQWINFDYTYAPSEYDSSSMRIFIRVNVSPGGTDNDYNFIINGLCVGQWSETTSTKSLGVILESLPTLPYLGVPALEYGIEEQSGYYISENNKLLAKNEGVPLVYGSDNVTKIYPSTNGTPSIIIPGNGFLNESGRYINQTVEFWMKINPETIESRKIFGPIETSDGLYVRDGVISLVIGNNIASHPVSYWYRPMLVHIVLRDDSAGLLVNGELVFSIPFDRDTVDLPSNNDFVAFYSYEDITNFEIDCISFYSYIIPAEVAKKRLVWGQGTDSPQSLANSFLGTNSYINFSNANYTSNRTYPDTLFWSAGYRDNLQATRFSISSPNYSLPEIYIGGKNINVLYDDNKIVNDLQGDLFFTFRPNVVDNKFSLDGTKWTEPGYIFFDSLSFIDQLSSFYAVFSTTKINQQSTVALITNSVSGDTLRIILESATIKYLFNNEIIFSEKIAEIDYDQYLYYPSYNFEQLYETYSGYYYGDIIDWEYSFAFGIDIQSFVNNFGYRVDTFFQSPENLQMYFMGDGVNTFEGKMHSIGFCNSLNSQGISDKFLSNGVIDYLEYEELSNYFCTYTLKPLIRYNRFLLDISISSYWEEYIPLSSFAGYVKDSLGRTYYDLDYLQINIGYPSINERITKIIENTGWTYLEIDEEYNSPIQKTYEIIDNQIITGYSNYQDLQNNNIVQYVLDTSKSSLKSYITFQLLSEGANQPISSFENSVDLIDCCFIDADKQNTVLDPYKAYKTKFEFNDGTIVYPPSSISFKDIAAVFHLEIKQEGILTNPFSVRDFEICSRALNQYEFNAIGTESGIPLYPYVKSGIYYDNKEKNPLRISKNRMPYLSLSQQSGVKVLGKQTFTKEYGISMPINQYEKNNLFVGAIQLWMKYDEYDFPQSTYPIFEIQDLNKTIEFIIVVDSSNKRGRISARNKATKLIEQGISFYQNGIRVNSPYVEFNYWNALGISFDSPLDFSEYSGYINLFRGCTFNNISYYETRGLGETFGILPRSWLRVLTENDIDNFDWQYWYDQNGSSLIKQWRDVYVVDETRQFSITPEDIYKTFSGTNRFVVDDETSVSIDSDNLVVLSDAVWTRFSDKPA